MGKIIEFKKPEKVKQFKHNINTHQLGPEQFEDAVALALHDVLKKNELDKRIVYNILHKIWALYNKDDGQKHS